MNTYTIYVETLKAFFISFRILHRKQNKMQEKNEIYPYLEKINDIRIKKKNFFEFEINDIIKIEFPKELNWLFQFNTKRFLSLVKIAIIQLISELSSNDYFFTNKNVFEKIYNKKGTSSNKFLDLVQFHVILNPGKKYPFDKFRIIGGNTVGKFIFLRVKITETNPPKVAIVKAVYSCSSCNMEFVRDIKKEKFKPFLRCPSKMCRNIKMTSNLFLNTSLTIFEKIQEIKVCDSFLDSFDQNLKIKIPGNHVRKMKSGEIIKVGGVLIPFSLKNEKYQNFIQNLIMEASFVEKIKVLKYYRTEKMKYEKDILKLFFKKNIFLKLSESFAPEVFGNLEIKKTLLLFAVEKFSYGLKNSSYFRNNFNILILGESGGAKTKLLKFFSNLKINSIYANRLDDINDFLFRENTCNEADMNTEHKDHNSKTFCLDNLNHLSSENCLLLLKILKKSIESDDFTDKIRKNNMFSLISAATLEKEVFEKSLSTNKSPFFFHLFPKFDLIFIIPDKLDVDSNKNMAKLVISNFKRNYIETRKKKFIKNTILKSYISEAQLVFPKIDNEIFDFILYYYVSCRSNNKEKLENNINIRAISLLIHLSFSLTRLKFQKSVSRIEIKEAIRLYEFSKISSRKLPDSSNLDENLRLKEKIYKNIRDISLYSKNYELNLSFLENFLLKKGFKREDFINCLGYYEDLNIWKISITQSKLMFLV
jgi:DNA replication licensing factor MCM7